MSCFDCEVNSKEVRRFLNGTQDVESELAPLYLGEITAFLPGKPMVQEVVKLRRFGVIFASQMKKILYLCPSLKIPIKIAESSDKTLLTFCSRFVRSLFSASDVVAV